MSQRRGGPPKETVHKAEELVPFGESMDLPANGLTMNRDSIDGSTKEVTVPAAVAPTTQATKPGSLSLDARYDSEAHALKLKQWKEGPYAAAMTASSWDEEYARFRSHPRDACVDMADNDGSPCVCCSALVCSMLGAGRVGNMAVLKQTTEWVEEVEEDESGESKTRRFTRPRLDVVVGPYWPMLICITYPLILGVSAATLFTAIPGKPPLIILIWSVCTLGLIFALAMTAFRDPGILPRHEQAPPQEENRWRWSDRAHSYKPRGSFFDPDTAVVVEDFDHTCPWTGTAIGRKNMRSFQWFVGLVFICLMFDIVLLTGGIPF